MQLYIGDALEVLKTLPDGIVQTCVTSPPFYGLRSYLDADDPQKDMEIGLEETPEAYVANLVSVFREVRRVLKDDGTVFLNLGDSYAGSGRGNNPNGKQGTNKGTSFDPENSGFVPVGCKPKDLIGIPWMVAFALRADGWWLRSDIIWSKPNPMPESVTDRPTKSHEYIFLLAKAQKYYYDAEAIAEDSTDPESYSGRRHRNPLQMLKHDPDHCPDKRDRTGEIYPRRNKRSVWTVTTKPYKEAHFATYPPDLIEPCILAGSRPGDTVLDPFAGSGTTLMVALKNNREAIGIELNPKYEALIRKRVQTDVLLLSPQTHDTQLDEMGI